MIKEIEVRSNNIHYLEGNRMDCSGGMGRSEQGKGGKASVCKMGPDGTPGIG